MFFRLITATVVITSLITGCTAVNTVTLNGRIGDSREIRVATGDLDRSYRSIGVTRITLTGSWLFGFIDLFPARLGDALQVRLAAEAERYGADAVVNVTFIELQYPPLLKILSIFTVLSPQYVLVTGELVEFTD